MILELGPRPELNDIVRQIEIDFWRDACAKLLERQKAIKPGPAMDAEKAVSLLKMELRDIAKEYKLECLDECIDGIKKVALVPFAVYVTVDEEEQNFFVCVPKIGQKDFSFCEWERAANWIRDYIAIDIKPLAEKVEKVNETFYLSEKSAEIAKASIKALCDSYLTQRGINYKLVSSFLKSVITVTMPDAMYEITVFHKPFSIDARPLMGLLQNPRETETKDNVICKNIIGGESMIYEQEARKYKRVTISFEQPDIITLQLGYALLPITDEEKGAPIMKDIKLCRSQIYEEYGLVLPHFLIIDSILLDPCEYSIIISGKEIAKGACKVDSEHSIPLTKIFKENIGEILNQSLVNELVNRSRPVNPDVVDDVFITHRFSSSKLKIILNALLEQAVSIRSMSLILETIADFIDKTDDLDFIVNKIKERM